MRRLRIQPDVPRRICREDRGKTPMLCAICAQCPTPGGKWPIVCRPAGAGVPWLGQSLGTWTVVTSQQYVGFHDPVWAFPTPCCALPVPETDDGI